MTSDYFFAYYNSIAQFIYDSTDLVQISSANFERCDSRLGRAFGIVPRAKQGRTNAVGISAPCPGCNGASPFATLPRWQHGRRS
jgi:hypothetical protein